MYLYLYLYLHIYISTYLHIYNALLGDLVLADSTFLDHLSMSSYLSSKECRLAELFLMAYKHSDIDKLDEAQRCPDLYYLDKEAQQLGKRLSIFGADGGEGGFGGEGEREADKLAAQMKDLLSYGDDDTDTNTPSTSSNANANAEVNAGAVGDKGENDGEIAQSQVLPPPPPSSTNVEEEEDELDVC